MKKLLLIDSYALIYRAYYAFMKAQMVNSKGLNTSAIYGYIVSLEDMINRLHPDYVGAAFDPKGKTFRHEAYPQYKAQRDATPEDIHKAVPYIKAILKAMNIPILEVEGYEADDVIGTIATHIGSKDIDVYMATPDKDYGQLVSPNIFIYRPRHSGGYEVMGEKEVCDKYGLTDKRQVIDLLGLMGDSSDNIPGCTGVGEKTAVKLIQQYGNIENIIAKSDDIKGVLGQKIKQQTEQILFSKFLATIKTDVPIEFNINDFALQKPQLSELIPIYKELEFRSFLKRYTIADTTKDLFESETELKVLTDEFATPEIIIENSTELPIESPVLAIKIEENCTKNTDIDLFNSIEEKPSYIYLSNDGKKVHKTESWADLKDFLSDTSKILLTDNYKELYKFLHKKGLRINCQVFDISIAHYLIQPEQHHDTISLCNIYLNEQINDDVADLCAAIYRLYRPINNHTDHNLLYNIEMPLVPVLAQMEMTGVRFNTQTLKKASQQLNDELKKIEIDIQQLAGFSFNVNSPKKVGEVLFETFQLDPKIKKTKSGQYPTSEDILLSLRTKHPIIDKILEYREIKKLLSTYIDALPQLINSQTGKIHTTYNQTITATGRLSSSNPNLQNLPIRSERGRVIREAVIADSNCLIVSADYSQIELRLMAHFSQDEHLLNAFLLGQDIHAATAAKIFSCSIENVTADMRRKAKTANFGIIYGISAFGLAQQLQSSRQEAQQLIDDYFKSFPKILDFIEKSKQIAREKGYAETLFGRKRYLPDINSRNATVRNFAERNAVNAPIQGTAADIIKIAMINIFKRIQTEHLKTQMTMQVHDELNFNVPKEEVEYVKQLVTEEMQQAVSLSVPLIAQCGSGPNWLIAH